MPIDARLREGLHRCMSAIDTDADRLLSDARRRGRRRLVIRRATAAGAVVALAVIIAMVAPALLDIVRYQRQVPAAPPSVLPVSRTEPILGTWSSEYTCAAFVRALQQDGVGDLAATYLVAIGMQDGSVGRLSDRAHPCAGATSIQRTQIFQPNGFLIRYQGERLVDGCRCYELIGDHTFVVPGDPGDPDIPLRYRIVAGTLTFDTAIPDRCASARCHDQVAFAVGQYAVGTWQRVDR